MGSALPTFAPAALVGRSIVLPGNARPDLAFANIGIVQPIAAGFVSLHTIPGQQFEVPQQITFSWVTSAVVGVRTLGIQFRDSSLNTIGAFLATGQQSENTSARYTFALDASATFVPNVSYTAPLPFVLMQPTQQWVLFGTGLDPGDIQNGLTHTELVIPTGPVLTTQPQPFITPVVV